MTYIHPVGTTFYNISSLQEGEKVRLIHAPIDIGTKAYPNAVAVQVMRNSKPLQVGSLAESTDPRSGQQLVLNSNPPWDNQFLMGTIAHIKITDTTNKGKEYNKNGLRFPYLPGFLLSTIYPKNGLAKAMIRAPVAVPIDTTNAFNPTTYT